jgi:hypothetical protein
MSLHDLRMSLAMSMQELSNTTEAVTGHRVWKQQIIKAEHGEPTSELTKVRILHAINHLHNLRGRPVLTIDDVIWDVKSK